MSINKTDYLYLELCTKITTITEELTLAATSYGLHWEYTRKVEVIHQHFVFVYTSSNANSEIVRLRKESRLILNPTLTASATFNSSSSTSSVRNTKGEQKTYFKRLFREKLWFFSRNKDPPFAYLSL